MQIEKTLPPVVLPEALFLYSQHPGRRRKGLCLEHKAGRAKIENRASMVGFLDNYNSNAKFVYLHMIIFFSR